MQAFKTLATAAALLVGAASAQAALVNRGGGMIYDTVQNITWLADMNYAKTSGHDSDGRMTWAAATTWANDLVYGGHDDWRLPTVNVGDTSCSNSAHPSGFPTQYYGYNCTGGELSHLFVADLGNKAGESVWNQTGDTQEQKDNQALFSNVQSYSYWAGLEYAPDPSLAWDFSTLDGSQNRLVKAATRNAVAVRPGDVAAAVPEPQTLALTMLALGAALVARRKRPLDASALRAL